MSRPGRKPRSTEALQAKHRQRPLSRFPAYLVACTLIWTGLVGLSENFVSEVEPSFGVLVPLHCAVIFILCGGAILAAGCQAAISRVLAACGLLASLYWLGDGIFHFSTLHVSPLDPARHLHEQWALLLGGVALGAACCTMGARGRFVARLMAVVVIVAAVALRFYSGWSEEPVTVSDTANLRSMLGVLAGLAVLSLSYRRIPNNPFTHRVVALTGITGSLVAVLAWYAITTEDRQLAVRHTEIMAERTAYVVETTIKAQEARVARMAERWGILSVPPLLLIQGEFRGYLRDEPALDLVAFLDRGDRVLWADGDLRTMEWLASALGEQKLKTWLSQVREGGAPRFKSWPVSSSEKVPAVTAAPLRGPVFDGGLIITVHDLPRLLVNVLGRAQRPVYLRLQEDDHLLYTGTTPEEEGVIITERPLVVHNDQVWRLSAWQSNSWRNAFLDPLPELLLLVCLIFTHLLTRSHLLMAALQERSRLLQHGALHDDLTGLPNKKHLVRHLRRTAKAVPPEDDICVVLFDLYGLQLINDSLGHDVGDDILKMVSERILAVTNGAGFVARLQGDEFVTVLPRVPFADAITITEKTIEAIAEPYVWNNLELRLSCNAGIAIRTPDHTDLMVLVREADLATMRAKQEGRSTWFQYSAELGEEVSERLALTNELQKAIERDELTIHYQPLVDGHTGEVAGIEALLRWPHQERGYVPPVVFIPLAEQSGLMVALSRWVLDVACRDIATLRRRGWTDFPVMVNISPSHFLRTGFVDTVQQALDRHLVPAQCLELEITEGVLLENSNYVIDKLHELKRLGVKISIDDFGTGYSSLNYLKNLPVDKIKIDRSFVNEVISDRHDAAITRAIIVLAHHLNIKVAAEGVETESQYWFLKRNFCDEFQGFLFAEAMSFDELTEHLLIAGGRFTLPFTPDNANVDRSLLLLDDEENILRALTRVLRRDGYHILTARTPQEAFSILASHNVRVILSDQRMPEMTGTEFFSRVKEMYPETVRLILSGYTELKSVTEAINRGAIYKYLTKPWDDQELRSEIAQAFKMTTTQKEA